MVGTWNFYQCASKPKTFWGKSAEYVMQLIGGLWQKRFEIVSHNKKSSCLSLALSRTPSVYLRFPDEFSSSAADAELRLESLMSVTEVSINNRWVVQFLIMETYLQQLSCSRWARGDRIRWPLASLGLREATAFCHHCGLCRPSDHGVPATV